MDRNSLYLPMLFLTLISALVPVVRLAASEVADESVVNLAWPQWRGPNRDGRVSGSHWPSKLNDSSLKKNWSLPLGPSYSGPIVSKNLVFTTETRDEKEEVVYAINRETGEQQWSQTWQGTMKVPFFAASNGSWIRSTPAYDGERLYVAGMRDVLVCFDAESGEQLWKVDFVKEFDTPLPKFGFVCSPLVDQDAVYVQAGASVVKLNKRTGNVLWRAAEDGGGMFGSAFSSPIIANVSGQRQLLAQTRQKLTGIDLEKGEVLWSQEVPAFRGMNILTPLPYRDGIFTSTYQRGSWLYQVSLADGTFQVSEAWTSNAQGYMSTPVIVNDHVYMHLQNGRFTCIDLATGERMWTSKPYGKYASLVTQDERILALLSDGRLLLLSANPKEFEPLGDVTLTDAETWAHLAIDGNMLFVRELNALSAYRWQ